MVPGLKTPPGASLLSTAAAVSSDPGWLWEASVTIVGGFQLPLDA
jgi:hypothetical protein